MNAGLDAGYGLAVRWSLAQAPEGIEDELREYVVGTSLARFMFLDGLAFVAIAEGPAGFRRGAGPGTV
jgi:hypothetical protein